MSCASLDIVMMYVYSLKISRLTALFLAAKTTNNPISLDDYTSHIPKTAPADVLDLEFLIAQSLGFEFAVWHAHRALWGLRLDMEVRFSRGFSLIYILIALLLVLDVTRCTSG